MKIELIYFTGCPNIEKTREHIKKACKQSEIEEKWSEINQSENNVPSYAKGYGSPTVLINGEDVTGLKQSTDCCGSGNCRIYDGMQGVPSIDIIANKIKETLEN